MNEMKIKGGKNCIQNQNGMKRERKTPSFP